MKMGVAIVPRMCVGPEIERGLLKELRMRQMRLERRLYLVYRQDRPLTAAAQALVAILRGKKTTSHGGKTPEPSALS
jgi:DNA-binding transcriptional LysR family regulator